jgi:phosphate transport system protein
MATDISGQDGPSPGQAPGCADRHILRVQEDLWADALGLAAVVESTLAQAVTALCHHRPELLAEVKAGEREVDRREVAIERECLRVLALYEPVASDFRRVLTVMRVNRDLERIGDMAVRIAKRARKLAAGPTPPAIPEPLEDMAGAALDSVRAALDALSHSDAEASRSVIVGDRRLDRYRQTVRAGLKESIRRDPGRVEDWLRLIDVARHLERVGDHAARIAEAVIYLKEGEIIRHTGGRLTPRAPEPRPRG